MPDRPPTLTPAEIDYLATAFHRRTRELYLVELHSRRIAARRHRSQWWANDETLPLFPGVDDLAPLPPIPPAQQDPHMPEPLQIGNRIVGYVLDDVDRVRFRQISEELETLRANDNGFSATLIRLQTTLDQAQREDGRITSLERQNAALNERVRLLEETVRRITNATPALTTVIANDRTFRDGGSSAGVTIDGVSIQRGDLIHIHPAQPAGASGGGAGGGAGGGSTPIVSVTRTGPAAVGLSRGDGPQPDPRADVPAATAGAGSVAPAHGSPGNIPAAPAATAAPAVTSDALRNATREFSTRFGLQRARDLALATCGTTRINDIPENRRQALLDAFAAAGEAPAVSATA